MKDDLESDLRSRYANAPLPDAPVALRRRAEEITQDARPARGRSIRRPALLLPGAAVLVLGTIWILVATAGRPPEDRRPPEGLWGPLAVAMADSGDLARIEGTLALTEDCAYIERADDHALLVWPADRTSWNPTDRSVSFRRLSGALVSVTSGQRVALGGSETDATRLDWAASPAPGCSAAARWFVSDVEPPAITAEGSAEPTIDASATREPAEQWWGPEFGLRPPDGGRVPIGSAKLSTDKRTLTITFGGSPAFLASDPCSGDFEPWVGVEGEALVVTVVGVPRQFVPAPDYPQGPGGRAICLLMAYGHRYHLALSEPFTGTTVRDLAGGVFYVAPPADAVVAATVPNGWLVQDAFMQSPGPPPTWVQVYGPPGLESGAGEAPGRVVLYQAFGIVEGWGIDRAQKYESREARPIEVTINGALETVWRHRESGEMYVAWILDGHSLALAANLEDMTVSDLVAMANGVRLPDY